MTRTAIIIAAQLRKDIGCHMPLIGRYAPQDEYLSAQSRSDRAQSLAKYLAQHAFGADFARACGLDAFAHTL